MRFLASLALIILACANNAPPPLDDIPPAPDGGPLAMNSPPLTFAMDTILLGETDRFGNASDNAWQGFGYDLDGQWTTEISTNTCTLAMDTSRETQVDGAGGVDNAFGMLFLSTFGLIDLFSTYHTSTADEVAAIRDGAFTIQIQLFGLVPGETNAVGVSTQVFTSGAYDDGAPAFDTTTDWPVLASSVVDGATIVSGAVFQHADGYVSDGTFVSGTPSTQVLPVPVLVAGVPTTLLVHHATITFTWSTANPSELGNGIVAGVLDPNELANALCSVLVVNPNEDWVCQSGDNEFAMTTAQMQDILMDGTNAAGVSCDGISIGLGFTARQIANPTKVALVADAGPD